MDPLFRAKTLSATANPNQLIYLALHQDYSSKFAGDCKIPSEEKCGEIILHKLLGVNHFGPLEHAQIVINFGGFPHSVLQQVRTHRAGISFDCQSFRYTGDPIAKLGKELAQFDPDNDGVQFDDFAIHHINELFYIRPEGEYFNRQGKRYNQTAESRKDQLLSIAPLVINYWENISEGMPYEMARGLVPFDYRQHFVMAANTRTVMHLLDMRHKKDAQLECQQWADLLFQEFKEWNPIISTWYEEKRLGRGRLAP